MNPRSLRRLAGGFTLIELLVTAVVILVLAALIFGGLAHGRARARETRCLSNMRQIGVALPLYCGEHNGNFPQSMHTTDDVREAWIFTLAPYLGNVDEVRICPADPRAEERREAKTTSYVLNEYLVVPELDPFGEPKASGDFTNLHRVPLPANTIAAFIGADGLGTGHTQDHTHSRNWKRKGWKAVLADIQPDRHRAGRPNKERTRGSANYLYLDGRVEKMDAARLKQLIDRKINIAEPPRDTAALAARQP
jgi:prepilin-type N-terminal cleavage/methylation domain-containing protein/prepilin-type processing-associated H-X9-DG protein